MRFLIHFLLLCLLPMAAWAQSLLPPCPMGTASLQWNDCVGAITFSDGSSYVGEFRNGFQHGQGTWSDPRGTKYVGEYRDGKRNGRGTQTWSDGPYLGHRYVGEYRDGKRHGYGTYSYPAGAVFEGEFRDDQRFKGTYTFANGDKYVGEWRSGLRNGQGIEYRADGTIFASGQWADGKLVNSYALDRSRFPFDGAMQIASTAVDTGRAERDRLASAAEAARRKQQELEQQLAAQAEEARRQQHQLQQQLAAAQAQSTQSTSPSLRSTPRNAHALVIGNAAYAGSGRLDNPVNDATAISQKLRSMGFTVTTVTDAKRQRLVQAMAQFRRSAASADLSLLFYSGHGVQIFGTNYILPIDVDQTDVAQATIQGVSLNSVVENFMPGKTKLVFLDACRDNPLQRTGDRSVSKGLAPISVTQGTLISYATKDGQVALDGVGQKNSPFTQALLEHIGDPQDIGVVLRKVREKVMQATGGKQQPWEYGSLTGGELVLSTIRRGGS